MVIAMAMCIHEFGGGASKVALKEGGYLFSG